jgi:oligopeptide/dipeptide ABC transporter ATP-binding protein
MSEDTPLLEVKNLQKYFPTKKSNVVVHSVEDVNFTISDGETLGIVGESGCGKSTTARLILRLLEPTKGSVIFQGKDILQLSKSEMRKMRRNMQIVFQDPFSSLDPHMKIGEIIAEPIENFHIYEKTERKAKIQELMEQVGLSAEYYDRLPGEFSGGQRQRIGIARALASKPKLLIADEPVSALDVSVRSQVLNLMKSLQQSFHLTYLLISHDLSVVKHLSDHIAVMYMGRIVEYCETDELYSNPLHPYTQSLISAVPVTDPAKKRERIILQGEVPSPTNPPSGCVFHNRCPFAMDICSREIPNPVQIGGKHSVACHLYTNS